ncbi:universal stress protein PHOS32-like [Silene latifolia]|uniref:universal stress protein PHOS32-like n=1 Tax=Silene latifolia TaxID=37657 RepID=UPI003D78916F
MSTQIPPIKTKPSSSSTTTVTVSSPRYAVTGETPTAGAARKIAIAVDLSDESAFAVKWAVDHYLRPGDAVVLVHVRPTSVLYGADWGSVDAVDPTVDHQKLEDDFDAFTTSKAADLAQPLIDAKVPYKIHIVKDHDMKERLCLEIERLGFNAVIMGSRGFGATKRGSDGRLGSVSDYCVRHCVCPVIVVRCSDEKDGNGDDAVVTVAKADEEVVVDEEEEYHDAFEERKATA